MTKDVKLAEELNKSYNKIDNLTFELTNMLKVNNTLSIKVALL